MPHICECFDPNCPACQGECGRPAKLYHADMAIRAFCSACAPFRWASRRDDHDPTYSVKLYGAPYGDQGELAYHGHNLRVARQHASRIREGQLANVYRGEALFERYRYDPEQQQGVKALDTPLKDEDYCASCGQVGCSHDGR
jgi:hypothetical protein